MAARPISLIGRVLAAVLPVIEDLDVLFVRLKTRTWTLLALKRNVNSRSNI